jgi:hypothetical protein
MTELERMIKSREEIEQLKKELLLTNVKVKE